MEKILEFLFALRATLDALTIQRHDEPLRARRYYRGGARR